MPDRYSEPPELTDEDVKRILGKLRRHGGRYGKEVAYQARRDLWERVRPCIEALEAIGRLSPSDQPDPATAIAVAQDLASAALANLNTPERDDE